MLDCPQGAYSSDEDRKQLFITFLLDVKDSELDQFSKCGPLVVSSSSTTCELVTTKHCSATRTYRITESQTLWLTSGNLRFQVCH